MNVFKHSILILSLCSIGLPVHAIEAHTAQLEESDHSYVTSIFESIQKNSGVLLAGGLFLGLGIYLYKLMQPQSPYGVIAGIPITQITVLNQFKSSAHGGGASCGYQALKNAIYIPRFLFKKASKFDLIDLEIVQQLCNKQEPFGCWRKLVIENSYKRSIKALIDDTLYQLIVPYKQLESLSVPQEVKVLEISLQKRFKEKIRGFYQGVLGDELSPRLRDRVLQELKGKPIDSSIFMRVKKSLLLTAIKESTRVIDSDIDGLEKFDFVAYAKSNEVISGYLPDDSAVCPAEGIALKISKRDASHIYNKIHPNNPFDFQGDWINEDEIAQLIAYERQPHGLLAHLPASFDGITVIDNVALLDQGQGQIGDVREIAERLKKAESFVHSFVVGLMSGQPGKETGSRHWITLVVCKVGGKINCFVTDSGGNARRLQDPVIKTLVKHLTQAV